MRKHDCGCGHPHATARIYRGSAPKCPIEASIPLIEVATEEDIKTLSNCFVHVMSNNKTFYIDSKHRFIICWAGDLYIDDYDTQTNPLNLRAQAVVDFKNNKVTYFNPTGKALTISADEATEEGA